MRQVPSPSSSKCAALCFATASRAAVASADEAARRMRVSKCKTIVVRSCHFVVVVVVAVVVVVRPSQLISWVVIRGMACTDGWMGALCRVLARVSLWPKSHLLARVSLWWKKIPDGTRLVCEASFSTHHRTNSFVGELNGDSLRP